MDLEAGLRKAAYDFTLDTGALPTISQLAAACSASDSEVREALHRLAAQRIVVLQPASDELLMLPPFSAVPTPFVVRGARHSSVANCAWDALGAAVMLRETAQIEAACGCCSSGMKGTPDAGASSGACPPGRY
jgi:hypothetical protein